MLKMYALVDIEKLLAVVDDTDPSQEKISVAMRRLCNHVQGYGNSNDTIFNDRCKALDRRVSKSYYDNDYTLDTVEDMIDAAKRIAQDYENDRNAKIVAALPMRLFSPLEPMRYEINTADYKNAPYLEQNYREWNDFITLTSNLMGA